MQICLIGAGHVHALLLKKLTQVTTPGIQWVLVNPYSQFYSTGLSTSLLSGGTEHSALEVSLQSLIEQVKARGNHLTFRIDEVFDLQPRNKSMRFRHAGEVTFEVASFNIAGESKIPGMPALKPVQVLNHQLDDERLSQVQIVGGGPVAVEASLCLAARFQKPGRKIHLQLVERMMTLLPEAPRAVQRKAMTLLKEAGVDVQVGKDYADFPADLRICALPPVAQRWFRESGLKNSGKMTQINSFLQTSHVDIFAVGEGTLNPERPFLASEENALRQSEVLFANLLAKAGVAGRGPQAFLPKKSLLVLMNSGDGKSLGYRNSFSLGHSSLNLWLKNRIELKFLRNLNKR